MSKKSCLISSVIALVIVIIIVACGLVCMLLSKVVSDYDFDASRVAEEKVIEKGGDDKIAIIKIEGTIMDTDTSSSLLGTSYASSQQIIKYLNYVIEDDSIKGVILSIDSPGGDVYATDIVYNKVEEVQSYGKKVVTLMKNTAASGGYYIAAGTDKIVASPITITGSIGVRADVQSLDGLYEKLGIETRTFTNSGGNYKTGEGYFDDNPDGEEDEILQTIIDEYFDRFVNIVSEGRGMEKDELLEYADGRIFSGTQAKEKGLIDDLGGYELALESVESLAGISNATVVEYQENNFWTSLAGYVSNVVNPTASVIKLIDPTPGVKLKYLYTK